MESSCSGITLHLLFNASYSQGENVKSELMNLLNDLPEIYENISMATKKLVDASNYYDAFVLFVAPRWGFSASLWKVWFFICLKNICLDLESSQKLKVFNNLIHWNHSSGERSGVLLWMHCSHWLCFVCLFVCLFVCRFWVWVWVWVWLLSCFSLVHCIYFFVYLLSDTILTKTRANKPHLYWDIFRSMATPQSTSGRQEKSLWWVANIRQTC